MDQIIPSDRIKELVSSYQKDNLTSEDFMGIRDILYDNLVFRDYNDSTKDEEADIRWKRNASQIIKDGYVYKGKACTDLVVVFLSFCRAIGIETYFVKMKNRETNMVHSVAQIKLGNDWYMFDVTKKNSKPEITDISKDKTGREYKNGWVLWKKGRDAWDIGLNNFDDINKIKIN